MARVDRSSLDVSIVRVTVETTRSTRPAWAAIRSGLVRRRATPDQPGSLAFPIAHDEPDLVAQAGQAPLDKLDGFDDHHDRALGLGNSDAGQDPGPDGWVDDHLEIAHRRRVREHDAAEGRAIQRPIRSKERRAETGDDGVERGLAAVEDVARDDIRVDGHDPWALGEPACDG